jgi:hypothetical protein
VSDIDNEIGNGKIGTATQQSAASDIFVSAITASLSVVAPLSELEQIMTDVSLAECATSNPQAIEMQDLECWLGKQ